MSRYYCPECGKRVDACSHHPNKPTRIVSKAHYDAAMATMQAKVDALQSELAALRNAPQAELTAAVVEAAHKLIAYRERQSATSFQLEKMDDYIRELDKTLAALASGAESETK